MNRLDKKMLILNAVPLVYMVLLMTTRGSAFDFHLLFEQNPKFDNFIVICVLGCLVVAPSMLLSSYYHKLKSEEDAVYLPFVYSGIIFLTVTFTLMMYLRVFLPQLFIIPAFIALVYLFGIILFRKLAQKALR
jgi:hypothetical protein